MPSTRRQLYANMKNKTERNENLMAADNFTSMERRGLLTGIPQIKIVPALALTG